MMKSRRNLTYLFLFASYLIAGLPTCRADLVLFNYTGSKLTFTDGPLLTPNDSISGIIGFDAIGSQFARSISLALFDGVGNEIFRMHVPDTSSPNSMITIDSNTFNWQSQNVPVEFELTMHGNVFGGSGSEQISIGTFGDLAVAEIGLPNESSAYNFQAGTLSVVPEPSSLLLGLVAIAGVLLLQKHRIAWRSACFGVT